MRQDLLTLRTWAGKMDVSLSSVAGVIAREGEEEKDVRELFLQLKPVCVDVLRSVSVESLGRLDETLRRQQPRLPPPLVEYVLFPLRTSLRKLSGSDKVLLERLLRSIALILSKAVPGQLALCWDIFQELFMFFSLLLDDRMSDGAGFGSLTEERSLHSLHCLQFLLMSITNKTLCHLYKNLSVVGHCVSVIVTAIQRWKSREIRQTALLSLLALSGLQQDTISFFTGQSGKSQDTSAGLISLRDGVGKDSTNGRAGETLASFLPGVTMAITKLLTSEPNLGQTVVNLSLLVWVRYVSLAIRDEGEEEDEEERGERDFMIQAIQLAQTVKKTQSQATPTDSTPSSEEEKDLRVKRNGGWRKEIDEKLTSLTRRMAGVLVSGGGWRKRMGVVYWAHCLLGNTHKWLVTMAPVLLEVVLVMSHDDYHQISQTATNSLEIFSKQFAQDSGELSSLLQERLYSLTSSLPRLMRQHDDAKKMSMLQLLAGYLKVLGPHTSTLTLSPPHLSHLILALLQTLELETTPPNLQEVSPERSVEEREWWRISLNYRHFRNSKVEELIFHCCQLLGYLGSLPALLHHLLQLYRSSVSGGCGNGRSSVLLVIISQVLIGAGGQGCVRGREKAAVDVLREEEEQSYLVGEVLDEVIGEDSWGDEDMEEEDKIGGGGGHSNILHCLQLQLVGICVHLNQSLLSLRMEKLSYQLLARAGSQRPEVAQQAISTLSTVASYSNVSVPQLITDNSDYIVNSICLALRDHTHCHTPLQVLKAVAEYGSEDVLPLMKDSIDELFLSLDIQLTDNKGVWSVLRSLAAALHRWAPETVKRTEERSCRDNREQGDFAQYFKSLRKEREEEEEEVEVEAEGDTEERESTVTSFEQTAVDILTRCPHYLPSTSTSSSSFSSTSTSPSTSTSSSPSSTSLFLSLTVLDCLHHCLYSLQHNHHILLPLIHKVWPPFLLRLSDSAHPVALRALEVLHDLCDLCGDFVRKRVVKGVWPVISQTLTKLAESSCNTETVYQYSMACKLQNKMIQTVGVLPIQLQVGPSDLESLVHACLPYLSCKQPISLTNSAITTFSSLLQYNPDLIWLLLQQMVPIATEQPPHTSLHPYKFPRMSKSEDFSEAIQSLLKLTNEYR